MRSRVGLRPTSPQFDAGIRIEPAPSDAVAAAHSPAATAAALPPLDPPGLRSVFHGLRVIPKAGPSVSPMIASSGVFVLPMTIAPAARRRRTSSLSWVAGFRVGVGAPARDLARHVLDVLHGDRDAQERPVVAGPLAPVGLLSVDERPLRHHRPERVQLRVEPLDPLEIELDQLTRRHLAVADQLRLASHTGKCKLIALHRAGTRIMVGES